jgi:hypothetical protein
MKRTDLKTGLLRILTSVAVTFAAIILCLQTSAQGQTISLTTMGTPYTQDFDTLSNTAGSTTNNLTINGWFMTETGGGARDNEQYAVDTGGSTTGDTYSYGAAAATDRALGQLRSGTLIPLFGAAFTNNTGATIATLDITYIGEQWRLGTAARTDQMNFEYSTNATDLNTGTWTGVAALNFITPDTATVGAKNGNAAADRTSLTTSITGLSIPNGATFWIRWNDTDATGADDGLAVDDFSLTPQTTSAAAAIISGRVMTADGRAISNAILTITGGGLTEPRTIATGHMGYYVFEGLATGQSYSLTISGAKRYTFANPTRIITLQDDVADANFVAEP